MLVPEHKFKPTLYTPGNVADTKLKENDVL